MFLAASNDIRRNSSNLLSNPVRDSGYGKGQSLHIPPVLNDTNSKEPGVLHASRSAGMLKSQIVVIISNRYYLFILLASVTSESSITSNEINAERKISLFNLRTAM